MQSANEEVQSANEELQSINEELETSKERFNLPTKSSLRIRPYKTRENKIDGAVMMFIDVDTLRRAQEFAENIVETVREPLLVLDADLRVWRANRSFYQTFKVTAAETEKCLIYDLGNGQWNIPELRRLLEEILPRNNSFEDFLVEFDFGRIGRKSMQLNARRARSA